MKLAPIDIAIVTGYFALVLGLGLFFARRANRSMLDYFLSARSMPWWLAGTAMVATTFSADTPLAVTEMVVKNGVAGNWLWWSMLPSGMLTVFFFARLWRRAAVVTDVELTELRYSGKPAAFLRGFRAAYMGLLVNLLIMGWVNLGMAKVLGGTLGIGKWTALSVCLLLTFLYTVVSGYWGVAANHGLQYLFEMGGAILLAVVAVALRDLYPTEWDRTNFLRLLASEAVFRRLEAGDSAPSIVASWQSDLEGFRKRREKYLLYSRTPYSAEKIGAAAGVDHE